MGIFLDSVNIDDVRKAMELGFVSGVTTNPSLMAKVSESPRKVIEQICGISVGPVFYQVTADTPEEREKEGREFHAINPDKVMLKIPATTENMALVAKLKPDIRCAVTAVFSGHQAYVACEAGARYLIPYVNRATRLMGDGCSLVAEIASVVETLEGPAEILAASIKSPSEAMNAVLAGAHHLTLPLDVLLSLGNHPLSDQAIAEFNQNSGRSHQ